METEIMKARRIASCVREQGFPHASIQFKDLEQEQEYGEYDLEDLAAEYEPGETVQVEISIVLTRDAEIEIPEPDKTSATSGVRPLLASHCLLDVSGERNLYITGELAACADSLVP